MLPPALKSRFEECRRELSPWARSDLDRLAVKLNMLKGPNFSSGDYLTSFTRVLVLTTPALSSEECKALAFYALCALCAASTGTGPLVSSAGSDTSGQLMQATQNMQETQMSFNLQYLQLQDSMQNENRQFTMVSNIMKTKHDTVKNSISNIR
jgi:hypothetical protein